MALSQILQSALSQSKGAAQAYSGLSSNANSSSSSCNSASNESSGAAWDTAEKDVSYIGRSVENQLSSVDYSHSKLESLLSQAASEHGGCSQDLRRALAEVDSAGMSDQDKNRVTQSINQALSKNNDVSYAESGTSSSLSSAERSVSSARSYAHEVANDSEGTDVSSAGSSLAREAYSAGSGYSQVSNSASNCGSYQSQVSDYIQEALFACDAAVRSLPENPQPKAPAFPSYSVASAAAPTLGYLPQLESPAPGFAGFLFSGKTN